MAALNVVNMQRQLTNAYPRPPASSQSQVPLGGTTSGSFLGGMSTPYNQPNALQPAIMDAQATMQFSPHSSLQPAFAPVHNLQHNPASLEPSMPSSNVPPRHPPNTVSIKQKQRSFLANLANIHHTRGSPLPPPLTAVQYPANYDPASSQWKSLECSSEPGAFRLAGKDVDLFKLWCIVCQLGGGQKVFISISYIICRKLIITYTQSFRRRNKMHGHSFFPSSTFLNISRLLRPMDNAPPPPSWLVTTMPSSNLLKRPTVAMSRTRIARQ